MKVPSIWAVLVLATLLSISAPASANNSNDEFNWNVTVELGYIYNPTLIAGGEQSNFGDFTSVNVWLDLYYKGFFVQSNRYRTSGSFGATELGYELHLDEDFELNIINKNYLAGFDQRNVGLVVDTYIEELEGIKARSFVPSQGIRYIRYLDESVYWVDVAVDLVAGRHRGWVVDTFYTKTTEYRNVDLSFGAGLTVFSADMTNYYFGVDQDEARVNRPFYEPGVGYRAELEAVMRYPLSQDWLFTAGATLSHYSNSISDSSLVARNNVFRFKLSVSYVF